MTDVYLNEIVVRTLEPRSIAQLSFQPQPQAFTLKGLGGLSLEIEVLNIQAGPRQVMPLDYPPLRGIGLALFPWENLVKVGVGDIVRVGLRNGGVEPITVALTLYGERHRGGPEVQAEGAAEVVDAPPESARDAGMPSVEQMLDSHGFARKEAPPKTSELMQQLDAEAARVQQVATTLDETLRAFGYDELRRFVLEQVSVLERARKMLKGLSDQLDQVKAQKSAQAVERYIMQAHHMRTEIQKLMKGE